MDEQLNNAPCGYVTLTDEGFISSINQMLIRVTGFEYEQLIGQHFNTILSVPARMFYQLYFIPIIKAEQKVEEMYMSLSSKSGEEIPVLINARVKKEKDGSTVDCVIIPIRKRNEYENELLIARKNAENALTERDKANQELEETLHKLEEERKKLLNLNKQNQTFKTETEKELQLAKKVQENLLTRPIVTEQVEIQAYYQASQELSGDIYGFYQINPYQYGIILLDVMGHGISSALVTMSLHSLFQRLILTEVTAEVVMKELNDHLHTLFQYNDEAWHYCTAMYLVIDTDTQEISYINAGHPSAVWQEADGRLHLLPSSVPPLGTCDGITFETKSFFYKKGGRILLYTDGVSDSIKMEELSSLFRKNTNLSLTGLKNKIISSLKEETPSDSRDDRCFILINFK